jgi:hypothetical protein
MSKTTKPVSFRLDKEIIERVRRLQHDPVRHKVRYGTLTELVERLFLEWIVKQNDATKPPAPPREICSMCGKYYGAERRDDKCCCPMSLA